MWRSRYPAQTVAPEVDTAMVTPPRGDVAEPVPDPLTGNDPRGLAGRGGVVTQLAAPPLPPRPPTGSEGTPGIAGRPAGRPVGRPGTDGRPDPRGGMGRPVAGSGGRPLLPTPGRLPADGSPVAGRPPGNVGELTAPVLSNCADPEPLDWCPEVRLDSRIPPMEGSPGIDGVPDGKPDGRPGVLLTAAASLDPGLPSPPATVPASAQTAAPAATNAVRRRITPLVARRSMLVDGILVMAHSSWRPPVGIDYLVERAGRVELAVGLRISVTS